MRPEPIWNAALSAQYVVDSDGEAYARRVFIFREWPLLPACSCGLPDRANGYTCPHIVAVRLYLSSQHA